MFLPPPRVDHRIDSFLDERRPPRRGAPEPLRLDLPAPGWPLLSLRPLPPEPPKAGARRWRLGWLWAPA